ncbi:hypothetical protein [Paralcaligenes ginsengisoli]
MWWLYTDIAANLIVAAASAWAVMSPRVNDGLFGKLALILLCFAAFANAAWAWQYPVNVDRSEVLFNSAAACMAVRCYWIKRHRASTRRWLRKEKS